MLISENNIEDHNLRFKSLAKKLETTLKYFSTDIYIMCNTNLQISRLHPEYLGIFDKITGKHIGNGKFEPINFDEKYAVFGILIGDVNFRGKGVVVEFIHACFHEILIPMNITKLVLGVNKLNRNAIKAYSKAGFMPSSRPVLKLDSMSLELELIS
jgi:RimJ/RimL family protein N-acetyltransferase